MKKSLIILGLALTLCLDTSLVCAQVSTDSAVVYDETLWMMKKRKLILEYMDLSEAEKSSFWPVYENYSMSIRTIESETLEIIMACNDPSLNLEGSDLEKYSKRMLQNDLLLDRVRIQFYKKFSKALSPSRASQFMQLDDNLRMMLRMEVQNAASTSGQAQASIREHID
jgi:hypothetical protein